MLTSAPLRAGPPGPVSGSRSSRAPQAVATRAAPPLEEAVSVPFSRCLSTRRSLSHGGAPAGAIRLSLLEHSCPRWGPGPSLRSGYRRWQACGPQTGLRCSAPLRSGRDGRLLYAGAVVSTRAAHCHHPAPAASQRPALPLACNPSSRGSYDDASMGASPDSPVRPSPACDPRTERGSLGTSAGFTPPGYPGRMPRRGGCLDTHPVTTSSTSLDPPTAVTTHTTRLHLAPVRYDQARSGEPTCSNGSRRSSPASSLASSTRARSRATSSSA